MSTVSKQSASVTAPTITTASSTLLAAGAGRQMWIVTNPAASPGILYLRFGTGAASSTDYSVAIAVGGYYECPIPVYGGAITAVLATGSSAVQVTAW